MTHKHKCDKCGHIWQHGEECISNRPAHTCSQCGTITWWKHHDDDKPAPAPAKADPIISLLARILEF